MLVLTVMLVGDDEGEGGGDGKNMDEDKGVVVLEGQQLAQDKTQGEGATGHSETFAQHGVPYRRNLELLTCAASPLPPLPPTVVKRIPKSIRIRLTASSEDNQPGHVTFRSGESTSPRIHANKSSNSLSRLQTERRKSSPLRMRRDQTCQRPGP